ncbi:RidA family protein [Nesterenkonia lutea]|uniref:Enamine deaminase RidA (YjgF/YER057c/UK114 family) n=1 Tax=Nesterenkonia lutea TaxID=272919 RepID=A0ABR9JHE6_9MICC|nr:Rid family hydrolase [Nesterenkonia lutea]MBE1525359.1 enamine deaminase RidA (YjgF/YER057c/UK114 family) [Nesterenkonia lutea]
MTASTRFIRSASLFPGVEYAYAAQVPGRSRLIFMAGACPLDEDGFTVGIDDCTAQAEQCVENLRTALRDAGAGLQDVVNTRVLVASARRADLLETWRAVRSAFGDHDPPSTLLGVSMLGYEHQLVEIEAVAAVQD